ISSPDLYPAYLLLLLIFVFYHATPTTEIYTLSLHDALPISGEGTARDARAPEGPRLLRRGKLRRRPRRGEAGPPLEGRIRTGARSEEHTSELQSHLNLVCRLLLEKKK